jgi:septin family protein
MSNLAQASVNPDEERAYQKLREKAVRFRILIIGRANCGKTTILQKICQTTDDPEIFDSKGNKVCCIYLFLAYLDTFNQINLDVVAPSARVRVPEPLYSDSVG